MKVLHVLRDLSRNGGVQRLVFDLLMSAKPEVKTSVLIFVRESGPDYITELQAHGITVYKESKWNFFRLYKIFRQHDIVHAHLFPALYLVGLLHPRNIYTEHNTTNNRRKKWWARPIESLIYKCYQSITCITPEVQHSLLAFLKWQSPSNTQVIYNGVNVAQLQTESQKYRSFSTTKQYHCVDLVMVGSLTEKKDQATIIRALKNLPNNVHLHLAGDGPTRSTLETLAGELNLQQQVTFHGVICDIPAFLAGKHIYIQSSNWEGFGLAAIEAMACGLLVLCSDVPGLNNLSDSKINLFTAGDSEALTQLIKRCYQDHSFCEELNKLSISTAQNYSIEKMSTKLLELYNETLSRKTSTSFINTEHM